ncbi:HEAT repeat domain-containing protein [Ramlibacter sp.]|uniref:HEAT repeat domain-containing protein n=1 Tax=Ramlibacter sp. TaxID=1917967 RepID=UPI0035B05713
MFSTLSDPILRLALGIGLVAVALTGLLTLAIVFLRLRLTVRERRWEAFVARWRPPLLQAALEGPDAASLPALAASEHGLFLRLWTYLHESLRGEAADRLNETARRLGLDASVRHLLLHGSRAERLQATLAAGYLRDAAAWDALVALARERDALIAVHAARALVRIEPLRAVNGLLPLLLDRVDWDLSRVALVLAEARQPFWLLLAKVLPRLAPERLPRALQLAEAVRIQPPAATLARLLQPAQPPEVLRAALRLCDSPSLGNEVRACLTHADAGVRAEAARHMARLGAPGDVARLAALLDDADWDVRMAAAQALGRLPFLADTELARLAHSHPAAEPLLRQVAAERGLG